VSVALLDLRASGARSNLPLPEDAVRCELCGGHFVTLARHLVAKHGLDAKRYRERFPGAPTQVPGLSADQAERALMNFHGRTTPRWTRERVIRALQAEMRRGRYPNYRRPGTSYRPTMETVVELFGSREAALRAAGIPVRTDKPALQRRPAPASWVEAYERGDRVVDIARRAGVHKSTVRRRLRVAGAEPRPPGRPLARVVRVCETCGATFEVRRSNDAQRGGARFCSHSCRRYPTRRRRVVLFCEACGEPFEVRESEARTRRFCSRRCGNPRRRARQARPDGVAPA